MPKTPPPPPKPQDYIVVAGSDGPRRAFRISVGLREGWDAEGRVFDVSEAVRTAHAWMRRRVEAGLPGSGRLGARDMRNRLIAVARLHRDVVNFWCNVFGKVIQYDVVHARRGIAGAKQGLPLHEAGGRNFKF